MVAVTAIIFRARDLSQHALSRRIAPFRESNSDSILRLVTRRCGHLRHTSASSSLVFDDACRDRAVLCVTVCSVFETVTLRRKHRFAIPSVMRLRFKERCDDTLAFPVWRILPPESCCWHVKDGLTRNVGVLQPAVAEACNKKNLKDARTVVNNAFLPIGVGILAIMWQLLCLITASRNRSNCWQKVGKSLSGPGLTQWVFILCALEIAIVAVVKADCIVWNMRPGFLESADKIYVLGGWDGNIAPWPPAR
eukprot:3831373-Rhodomonas_salina.1